MYELVSYSFFYVESRVRLVAYGPVVPAQNLHVPQLAPGIPVNQAYGMQVNVPIPPAFGLIGALAINQANYGVTQELVDPGYPVIVQLHNHDEAGHPPPGA